MREARVCGSELPCQRTFMQLPSRCAAFACRDHLLGVQINASENSLCFLADAPAAFALVEWAEGDVETARQAWNEAFEEAERINHNQSMGEPDELDRAIAEQAERFDRAEEARKKFRIV